MFLVHIHFWCEIHIWWPEWENQKATTVPRFDVGKQGRCWRSWVEGHRTMFCKNTRYSTSTALAFHIGQKTPLLLHNIGAGFGRYFVGNCINWIFKFVWLLHDQDAKDQCKLCKFFLHNLHRSIKFTHFSFLFSSCDYWDLTSRMGPCFMFP